MKKLDKKKWLIIAIIVGIVLVITPMYLDSSIMDNCQKQFGEYGQCNFSDFRYANYFKGIILLLPEETQRNVLENIRLVVVSLYGVSGVIGGLLVIVSGIILLVSRVKKVVQKIKVENPNEFQNQANPGSKTSAKSLLEMKKLFDEKKITEEEFNEYKKKHLSEIA